MIIVSYDVIYTVILMYSSNDIILHNMINDNSNGSNTTTVNNASTINSRSSHSGHSSKSSST